MPSKNESILQHLKVFLVGTIIDRDKINVGSIIVYDILMRHRQEQTSLSFLILITQLCETVEVPFQGEADVRITPTS